MINLTKSAANTIFDQMKIQTDPVIGIRLKVKSYGCNGFGYEIEFEYSKKDDDLEFESNDISIYIKDSEYEMVKGTTIDFVKEGLNTKFIFINPNEKGSCGCGMSFNIK